MEPFKKRDLRQSLHIAKNKKEHAVRLNGYAIAFVDKDSGHHVIYIPGLELSGYGKTEEKAQELLKFSYDEFAKWLLSLSSETLREELEKLGWNRNSKSDFSKAHVDIDGHLKDFDLDNYRLMEIQG